jgi:hypothetical protein
VVTVDDIRAIVAGLPRAYEVVVADRVKFRVGRLVFAALSRDETLLGFGYPKQERAQLVAGDPARFVMPARSDERYNWVQARMAALDVELLDELVSEAWAMCVPKGVAAQYFSDRTGRESTMPAPTELLGTWQLRRRLVDRRAARFGHVHGRLELTVAGAVVRWRESGELAWGGGVFEVSRELHIVPAASGWQVRFADGRPFHRWRPGHVVEHVCRADRYRGLVDVDPECNRLRVLWDVTGPGKEQRIVTRCVRSLSREAPGRGGAACPA